MRETMGCSYAAGFIGEAFDLLEKSWKPRTTLQAPFAWTADENDLWRNRYMHVDDSNREVLAEGGRKRREQQIITKQQINKKSSV